MMVVDLHDVQKFASGARHNTTSCLAKLQFCLARVRFLVPINQSWPQGLRVGMLELHVHAARSLRELAVGLLASQSRC
jgi:hypothetical protein